ncbi:hypothetical protein MASR1M60_19570 [Rhodocyclaceae bacterium]
MSRQPCPLVPVWVIQDSSTGRFLGPDLELHSSLKLAGRLYSEQSARETASSNFSYNYEIHQFYEFDE